MQPLIKAKDLNDTRPAFVVVDARFRLNDPRAGAKLFSQGHIPGAQFADLDTELSGERNGRNGRHPFPRRLSLVGLFSAFGINPDTPVVVYDDADHAGAARAWFLLRWMGHEKVYVLDGGLKAWIDAGYPLEKGVAKDNEPGNFPDRPSLVELVTTDELAGRNLVDARAPERYRGEVEPLDAQAGHIPGAENLFYQRVLGADGRFLPKAELAALLPEGKPTFYCGSGVTGAVLALAAAVAEKPSALYAGSWSEYSSDPAAPVAKGEKP